MMPQATQTIPRRPLIGVTGGLNEKGFLNIRNGYMQSVVRAGGIPVLAHPCHLKGNVHAIVAELCALGLGGIEAYYTTSTAGQTQLFLSLAAQHGLMVTCGSDFHGDHRPASRLGVRVDA